MILYYNKFDILIIKLKGQIFHNYVPKRPGNQNCVKEIKLFGIIIIKWSDVLIKDYYVVKTKCPL